MKGEILFELKTEEGNESLLVQVVRNFSIIEFSVWNTCRALGLFGWFE